MKTNLINPDPGQVAAGPILTVIVTVTVGYDAVVDEQEISFIQTAVEHTRLDQIFV